MNDANNYGRASRAGKPYPVHLIIIWANEERTLCGKLSYPSSVFNAHRTTKDPTRMTCFYCHRKLEREQQDA